MTEGTEIDQHVLVPTERARHSDGAGDPDQGPLRTDALNEDVSNATVMNGVHDQPTPDCRHRRADRRPAPSERVLSRGLTGWPSGVTRVSR